MDAPEDDLDIKLQKISGDLIADFDKSLQPFLRKQQRKQHVQAASGNGLPAVRLRVRTRETARLISSLLDPFQELPQLLDPHLPVWLSALGDAYLEYYLTSHLRQSTLPDPSADQIGSGLLMPLPRAICKLLYTFCKIRGEKVVVRFLSNEARYLEVLLAALEEAERTGGVSGNENDNGTSWAWEERYVVLLWLSHLMLAPFDLSSMSSQEMLGEDEVVSVPGLVWPANLPSITTRILPLAIECLASPGKERDASKALLVRISMRRDMQQLGVLDALVRWALGALGSESGGDGDAGAGKQRTPYHYIGVLSYLAGILASSADTSDMNRYLTKIFYVVHGIAASEEGGKGGSSMMASALARKTMIKVIRAITVLILRDPQDMEGMEIVETTIGFLLESLADNDTPVRFAASKALSIITLRLDEGMASQVVEAVLESLNQNVLRVKASTDSSGVPKKDLSMVDPLEWHGLMLTLSHLLYRRSPPAENLADIVQALLMGLSFERRSTSGSSTGANVRDAACFGVWALARRYTTSELLAVPTTSFVTTGNPDSATSIQQIIATALVTTACLDPSGNIRRGSSAALQELIGRHPDTVEKGIWVVQTVDYHAVALRSRAVQDVALGVTKLAGLYGEAILEGLLGWRGVGDADAAARRAAGVSYGAITAELASLSSDPVQRLAQSVSLVLDRIKGLEARQVEERHGLFFSFAAVLDALAEVASPETQTSPTFRGLVSLSLNALLDILEDSDTKTYRKPELIAEAASRLIISSFPALQATTSSTTAKLLPGHSLMSKPGAELSHLVNSIHRTTTVKNDTPTSALTSILPTLTTLVRSNLQKWLIHPDIAIVSAASDAAVILMLFCSPRERAETISGWAESARRNLRQTSKTRTTSGHFSALAAVYPLATAVTTQSGEASQDEKEEEKDKDLICNAIVERWRADVWTDTRACILQSLTGSELLARNTNVFLDLVAEGLDDYTTTARGDVGSLVRFEAIRATRSLWERELETAGSETAHRLVSTLFLRILRLAAEKLDRVRVEAQAALAVVLKASQAALLRRSTFSSQSYFIFLLDLLHNDWLHPTVSSTAKADPDAWMDALLAGLVSSADTGNEELVIATRAALCAFCERSPTHRDVVCGALARNLKTWQGTDRVLVPTLEVVAFLFHVGIFEGAAGIDYKTLCLRVQKACYKTGNVRKIEACVRVYGAIAELGNSRNSATPASAASIHQDTLDASVPKITTKRQEEGIREARVRLGALMSHPWPRVKSTVVDELWGLHYEDAAIAQSLKSVDWGKAEKAKIRTMVEGLGLV
ncbi:tubulin folding cofactor D C terminal-domain-containing protein [Dichotomopilus funicola]|uniref:Tubulin folding cofactor D C terminal-domain-containing protein n=1 Tax=Dichotomopilus funicola TaxID=1934379 RepID=A0AAN6V0D8_9PEZI|nr:tubulin folding cofactor D C terminal-domain-containing protein [Dichotomopilus funicola]